MAEIFDSRRLFYKSPAGALRLGQAVTLTLAVPAHYGFVTPYMLMHKDGETEPSLFAMQWQKNEHELQIFSISVTPPESGLYFYHFDLYKDYQKLYRRADGGTVQTSQDGEEWQLTVYDADFSTPEFCKGGVMYQIFPDRFYEKNAEKPMPFPDRIYHANKLGAPYFWPTEQADGYLNRDYYGGDFAGIQAKLPYLQRLGVTVIYLNPIFEAHANHRYNTADYRKADPLLGTNEEFALLCRKAAEHGIKIILDGVFSHTGSDSIYFNREGRYAQPGAWQSAQSEWRSWYFFGREYPKGYRCWWNFDTLPEVNEDDAKYREFICGEGGVIDYWLQQGASGFRLDVADELPDGFIAEIRKAVKRNGADKLLIGEVWEDATTKFAYGVRRKYLLGQELDSVMNYPFRTAILRFLRGGRAEELAHCVESVCGAYPAPALHTLMNFLGTHDTERAVTALAGRSCEGKNRIWQSEHTLSEAEYERGVALLREAYALLFFMPGIPCVYYGDEIAMEGYKDPFNRGYYNWDKAEERIRPVIRTLAKLRRTCPAFAEGRTECRAAAKGVVTVTRTGSGAAAAVAVNNTDETVALRLLGETVRVAAHNFAVRQKGAVRGEKIKNV